LAINELVDVVLAEERTSNEELASVLGVVRKASGRKIARQSVGGAGRRFGGLVVVNLIPVSLCLRTRAKSSAKERRKNEKRKEKKNDWAYSIVVEEKLLGSSHEFSIDDFDVNINALLVVLLAVVHFGVEGIFLAGIMDRLIGDELLREAHFHGQRGGEQAEQNEGGSHFFPEASRRRGRGNNDGKRQMQF
jgi:hypothetical protein